MMPASITCPICNAANQSQAIFCRACGYVLQQNATPSAFNTATGQLLPKLLLRQRYHVLHPIGQGGMGAVYEAEDTQLGNRKVALKEMRQSGLSPQEITEAADAFRQEALLLAGLQNPHLPNIYDHFSEFGRWYLVMSFIHGETLEAYLSKARNSRLPLEESLQVCIQLCTVLGYLHTQQPPIIFRDLKPANIMRTADGHIYLIDFGIARLFKPGQARDTSAYASMGYAAPEQYGKAQTTPQSDIYSLGVVLHQLLMGYHPSSSPFSFPPLGVPGQVFPAELVVLVEQMHNMDESKRPTSTLIVKQKLQDIAATLVAPTRVKTPMSLPSTIPAKTPSLPPTIPAVKMSAPVAAKSVGVWSLGKQHWIAMIVGVVIYSIVTYLLNSFASLQYFSAIYSLSLLVPLFFATRFGPWVGLMTAMSGALIGTSVVLGFSHIVPYLYYYVGLIPFGLLAGLASHRVKSRSTSYIRFAMLMGLIALLAFELITIIGMVVFEHISLSTAFAVDQPWWDIIPLVLLPLVLLIRK